MSHYTCLIFNNKYVVNQKEYVYEWNSGYECCFMFIALHANLEILFSMVLNELRGEKRENENSDAQIPFTKYFSHVVFIDSGEWIKRLKMYIVYCTNIKECQQSKQLFTFAIRMTQIIQTIQWNLRNSDIQISNTFLQIKGKQMFLEYRREWAHQALRWSNFCLFTQTFILNDKEVFMSTDDSKEYRMN